MTIKLYKREQDKNPDFYRRQGLIPGILYGPNIPNTLIYGHHNEISYSFKKSQGQLANLCLADETKQNAFEGILQDCQIEPTTNKIIHFDIFIPALDKPIITTVPLVFLNAEELEKQGFIINKTMDEIEIEAFAKDIPEKIEVDLSGLSQPHQSLFIKDLKITANLKINLPAETPVVSILLAE
jgi:large subunit ribosomal protein L25